MIPFISLGRFFKPVDFGNPQHVCDQWRAIFWEVECLKNSSRNKKLVYPRCCEKGAIKLPLLKEAPPYLASLMNLWLGSTSVKFKENIRIYNSMFAFTSMGGNIDHDINKTNNPYIFKMSGQIYHAIYSLLPSEG